MVHDYFDRHGGPPGWLDPLGPITGYRDPPSFSTYHTVIEKFDIKLTGAPDAIFVRPDGSHVIADYKTSRLTAAQDNLLPMYETQLNGYAVIGLRCGFTPISGLGLIYFEPQTAGEDVSEANQRDAGFTMGFSAKIKAMPVDLASLEPLLATARKLYDQDDPPGGRRGCEDCPRLDQIMAALGTA
jgi:RecB family exonuclease